MRAAIECVYENETISIEEALELRAISRKKLEFSCIECGEALRAHRAGENIAAHFEHLQRNNSCSFSASANPAYTGVGYLPTYDINDLKAIEGYEVDKKLTTHARNAKLVIACKERDNYKCRACNFKLKLHGKYVVECHHIKPVALSGEREVSLDELICLCPTCHRIAHTRSEPLKISEIKLARGLT
jgi:Zn finger protein HypA/HybF involved in hydrogenase expression